MKKNKVILILYFTKAYFGKKIPIFSKKAVNYKELHCGKPIAFGKRKRKAEVLSELFEVERIIAQRTKSRKLIICLIYLRSGNPFNF
jgi:hypothetical protein